MRYCVLLSGGMDSAAALHWALEQGDAVEAIWFAYEQPSLIRELDCAHTIARSAGVYCTRLDLPRMERLNPTPGRTEEGLSLAFVPGRNAIFLTRAIAHAARHKQDVALVIGANKDDAAGFPDCRAEFFAAMENALRAAFGGLINVRIETPWLHMTKAEIVRWCILRPAALGSIRASVSCYRGTGCRACDPCKLRSAAFETVGVDDFVLDGFT